MLQTAKLNALDPEAYLADVIDHIANRYPINRLGVIGPYRVVPLQCQFRDGFGTSGSVAG
jgi:hypothetical protein